MKTAVILVAAGKGMRFGGHIPKQFLPLKDMFVINYSLLTFLEHEEIDTIQPVIDDNHIELYWNVHYLLRLLKVSNHYHN